MGLFSADVEGGVPDRTMAKIPLGDTMPGTLKHKGPGFSATKALAARRKGGLRIADAFKAGIPAAGKRLEKATIDRAMGDLDEKAVLAGKKAKFGRSRTGMYGSTAMSDEMRRRTREESRGRAGITKAGIKAGRALTSAMVADYVTMRGRAEEGKLWRSPEHTFGLPTMPAVRKPIISPIIPTYTTTKTKKKKVYEETPGGTGGDESDAEGGDGWAG